MAFCKSYTYNKKNYIFKLTRSAQLEIERIQEKQQSKVFEDEETIKMMGSYMELQKGFAEIEKMEEGEQKEKANIDFISQNASVLAKARNLNSDDSLELYELGYILLKNYPKNPPLTKDEYKLMTASMEDEMGLEETVNFFVEMRDKVFTEMEQINKVINKPRMTVPKETIN